MISRKDKGLRIFPILVNSKARGKMEQSMEKANSQASRAEFLMANFKTDFHMEKVSKFGMTAKSMTGTLSTELCKGRAASSTLMELSMREILKTINDMVGESSHGLTGEGTKGSGKMGINTELAF